MKDSEFIELLNLYLDHEISAADAARLEAEIRGNLERRKVYLQYCRMQQACRMIAADFAAGEETTAAEDEKKVVPFSPAPVRSSRRGPAPLVYAVGALAAAACVALVMVGRRSPSPAQGDFRPAAEMAVSSPGAPGGIVIAPAPVAPARGLVSVARPAHATTLVANPLFLTGSTQAEAVRAAAVRQADNQLAWLEAMQLAPLPARGPVNQELHFSARLVTEGRALGHRSASQPNQSEPGEEMVTFQFVK